MSKEKPKLDPAHVRWQKQVLDMMKVGGTWVGKDAPVMVKKISENEVVIVMAPNDSVRQHIEAAGYKVVEIENLKPPEPPPSPLDTYKSN